jgi:hypothetical protein
MLVSAAIMLDFGKIFFIFLYDDCRFWRDFNVWLLLVGLEAHCKPWKEVDEQSELGQSMPTWKGKHGVWITKILDKDEENIVN